MADTAQGGNGHQNGNGRFQRPAFRNDFSLGQIVTMLVSVASVFGGLWAISLRYENRMTALEINASRDQTQFTREIERLDRDIGLSRDVRGLQRETRELINLHRVTP